MIITNISLNNFRNYKQFKLDLPAEGILFTGKNGVGKTNLLEALYFLAYGKSFRTNNDSNIIMFEEDFFRIEGETQIDNININFKTVYQKPNRKKIFLNDNLINKLSELYKYLKIVLFTPEDIEIVAGTPKKRRSFLNFALSQYDETYLAYLKRYRRILDQRNYLLKDKVEKKMKESWDKEFVKTALKIIKIRKKYIKEINPILKNILSKITNGNEKIALIYKETLDSSKSLDESLDKLDEIFEKEVKYERTLLGPHLDDIKIFLDNKDARIFSSHGQKRSIALALKFTQSELVNQKNRKNPILLFDDVFADLDSNRTKNIFELLNRENQIFITSPQNKFSSNLKLKEIHLN